MIRLLLAGAAALVFATSAAAQQGQRPNPDADHDGKVTLAEFKASQAERQARLFARLDANKDGKITQAEADAGAKQAQAAGHGGRSAAFLMRADANHDGAVTKAEFAAAGDQRFKLADTNHDGWLSRGEILQMRQAYSPN